MVTQEKDRLAGPLIVLSSMSLSSLLPVGRPDGSGRPIFLDSSRNSDV